MLRRSRGELEHGGVVVWESGGWLVLVLVVVVVRLKVLKSNELDAQKMATKSNQKDAPGFGLTPICWKCKGAKQLIKMQRQHQH